MQISCELRTISVYGLTQARISVTLLFALFLSPKGLLVCGFLILLVICFKTFVFVLLLFCLSRLSEFCGKSLLTLRPLIIITISSIAACMCAHTHKQTSQQMLQASVRQTQTFKFDKLFFFGFLFFVELYFN